jgi:hypothetical protein
MAIHKLCSLFSLAILLFVALAVAPAPASADVSHARIIRLSYLQGDVRFTREAHGDPLTDDKNLWERAMLNLPIRQGYVLATDRGSRATVEFESGALAFLNENTVIEFYDLSLDNGAHSTRLVLRQGSASFYITPSNGDYFSVTGGDFTAEATSRASFRLNNFDDGSEVSVTAGHLSVLRKEQSTALGKGQSLSASAGAAGMNLDHAPAPDDFDRWVSASVQNSVTATNAGTQYANNSGYTSGFGDLYTYGNWLPINGYGYGWQPFGAGLGWSPFGYGGWFQDSAFGWGFIGNQPWGWLPYHYGSWLFEPGFGWVWFPSNIGRTGWQPSTVTFVRSKSGTIGAVPVHPADVPGKTPHNLQQAIFPVSGGAISNVAVANSNEQWKVEKSPSRDALSNSLSKTVRPDYVSRSLASSAGSRAVSFNSAEHRFVSSTTNSRAGSEQSAVAASASAHSSNVQSTARNTAPAAAPRRPLPPAPTASARNGDSRSGSGSTGRSSAAGGGRSTTSAPSASAHPSSTSSGGGRTH